MIGAAHALAVLLGSPPSRAAFSSPARWHSETLELAVHEPWGGARISAEELRSAAERAAAAWSRCGRVTIKVRAAGGRGRVAEDGVNAVVVAPSLPAAGGSWSEEGTGYAFLRPYVRAVSPPPDGEATAMAEIVEADLVLLASHPRFSAAHATHGSQALEAALLHEIGHALGLEHPCADAVTVGVAEAGRPRVACRDFIPGAGSGVMVPDPLAARLLVLEPSSDERRALASRYGRRSNGCGACGVEPQPPPAGPLSASVALCAALLLRLTVRRRSGRPGASP